MMQWGCRFSSQPLTVYWCYLFLVVSLHCFFFHTLVFVGLQISMQTCEYSKRQAYSKAREWVNMKWCPVQCAQFFFRAVLCQGRNTVLLSAKKGKKSKDNTQSGSARVARQCRASCIETVLHCQSLKSHHRVPSRDPTAFTHTFYLPFYLFTQVGASASFLDASSHLLKKVCPSICRLVSSSEFPSFTSV